MKPILFAIAALLLFASQNVFLEVKLSKYSEIPLLFYFNLAMFPLAAVAWGYVKATGQPTVVPQGGMLVLVILSGILYFVADYCFISAYTSGGQLLAVSTIVVLFPAFSSLIKYLWVGGTPNRYHVAGYLLGAVAVVLLAKGEMTAK